MWWQKFIKKADKVAQKVEQKGFELANKAHIITINCIILGLGYGIYTILRDYNNFFLQMRQPPNQYESIQDKLPNLDDDDDDN